MRVTEQMIKNKIEMLNRMKGITGKTYNVKGAYTLDCAYGGYSLHEYTGSGGAVHDIFYCGHITKRDLLNRIDSFIAGMEAGKNE